MAQATVQITFAGPSGTVRAQLAQPSGPGPWPAIVLLQEGIGVTAHLRTVAERFADTGYLVLVPDLYSHDRVRASLDSEAVGRYLPLARGADREAKIAALPADQQAVARTVASWFSGRDTSTYLPDARAAVVWLQTQDQTRGEPIAAVGFSLGGGLVAQLAVTERGLAAGVIFYGSGPAIDAVKHLRIPLQGHYAENDPAITAQVPALAAAIASSGGTFTPFIYTGAEHGFFNETRLSYHASAAAQAWERALRFLRQHLRHPANRVQSAGV